MYVCIYTLCTDKTKWQIFFIPTFFVRVVSFWYPFFPIVILLCLCPEPWTRAGWFSPWLMTFFFFFLAFSALFFTLLTSDFTSSACAYVSVPIGRVIGPWDPICLPITFFFFCFFFLRVLVTGRWVFEWSSLVFNVIKMCGTGFWACVGCLCRFLIELKWIELNFCFWFDRMVVVVFVLIWMNCDNLMVQLIDF